GNVSKLRQGFADLGYDCPSSPTAIIPIMIGDEAEAIQKSKRLFELGIMVIGFGFPVVPRGEARLRVQVSAALQQEHIDRILDAFAKL
ncbi:MAG: aminotransferase class I/II-fold pyridoxal phosphate-dependent enzyme, partial [Planctomycetota bacterium]|nr:aminotransferase class I/II-fold pyridoxal phosphate-dependent enzyme [Planctomycetota bacterium]